MNEFNTTACEHCGCQFPTGSGPRSGVTRKRFCSDKCTKRAYYKAHSDSIKSKTAKYYLSNHAAALDANRRRYNRDRSDPERWGARMAKHRAWRAKNPHLRKNSDFRRRQRMILTSNMLPPDEPIWEAHELTKMKVKELCKPGPFICPYCEMESLEFHIDHSFPLSRGGIHIYWNLVKVCVTCNLKKGDRMPWEMGIKPQFLRA